jgi:hypothetical protein
VRVRRRLVIIAGCGITARPTGSAPAPAPNLASFVFSLFTSRNEKKQRTTMAPERREKLEALIWWAWRAR